MIHEIGNAELSIAVKRRGAEWCSLRGADGHEYLWQAAPGIWARHAPLLFPIVGKLAQGAYQLNGTTYRLPPHGFARDLEFELVGQEAARLRYRLTASEATRSSYPFEFVLERSYELRGASVVIGTTVGNTGSSVMPFSIGEHPGFNLDWERQREIDGYYLEFDQPESGEAFLLDAQGLLSSRSRTVLDAGRRLPLSPSLFDDDALIFKRLRSTRVALCSRVAPQRLVVEFPGYPSLGIWAKPGAPYVCIEPWYGYADPAQGHDGQLMNKPGILHLAPGGSFACHYSVSLDLRTVSR